MVIASLASKTFKPITDMGGGLNDLELETETLDEVNLSDSPQLTARPPPAMPARRARRIVSGVALGVTLVLALITWVSLRSSKTRLLLKRRNTRLNTGFKCGTLVRIELRGRGKESVRVGLTARDIVTACGPTQRIDTLAASSALDD